MKLERLPEYVLRTVVTLIGIGLAIYVGLLTGEGQGRTLSVMAAVAVVGGICLTMRTRIWMLIPICWPLMGQIYALPVPFALREVVILIAFGMFLGLKALKVIRMKPGYNALDFWLLVNLLYLVTAYIRNPVGTSFLGLGTDRVGGRPYVSTAITFLGYWVLARVTMTDRQAVTLPIFMMLGRTIEAFVGMITYRFPATVPILAKFYSGINPEAYEAQDLEKSHGEAPTGRQAHLAGIGAALIPGLCSYFRPLTIINPLHVVRFALFAVGMYATLASGHRSLMMGMMVTFLLASYFHKGMIDVVRLCSFGVPAVALVIVCQGVGLRLPYAAQRTLSFLPGKWDPDVVQDAKGSTEWRTEMWKIMLTSDKYIKNKWLGDGFGFTLREFEAILAAQLHESTEESQESVMIAGGVHSGPISTIRYVGVVGLLLYYAWMFYVARFSWKLIRRAKGTPFFVVSLFVGVPMVWEPFGFSFVFGAFDSSLPGMIFNVGMLKMLTNSLDAYEADQAPAEQQPEVETDFASRRGGPVLAPVGVGFTATGSQA
jgi:hypothetical protein